MTSRRRFLQQVTSAGMAMSANAAFGRLASAQSPATADQTARVFINSRRSIAPLDRNLFGSFLEHLGRAIYEGIYEPRSRFADVNGFRRDVMDEIRNLAVPIVRYPGGNFVSGYNWLDGVGPKQDRPRVLEKAWNSIETNQFGTNEFMAWCKAVGTLPMMGLNLGSGTAEQAAALVEYCNVDRGTKWSDLRREHGYDQPYNVKHWCLGNEMDGNWQIGQMTAIEYGRKAQDAARQMRYVDRSLSLIACGSSGPGMSTYLDWDRQVLEQCYDRVDGLSLHRYYENTSAETGGDSRKFVAMNLAMDRQIAEGVAVCDVVRGRLRSRKTLWLSFDEWNVWYRARNGDAVDGRRQEAPHLLEEIYNLEDALLVGGLVITLLRNADRVKIGCLAQLVNVIAPIMTNANGLFRQTIYYPYSWALQYARGRVLNLLIESPTYNVPQMDAVGYIDAAATVDPDNGRTTLFVLNRDLSNARQVELVWEDAPKTRVALSQILTGNDLKAVNGFDAPERVRPQPFERPSTTNGRTRIEMPARSYTVMQWEA
jgi:alpha-N-arabinofuranosidase